MSITTQVSPIITTLSGVAFPDISHGWAVGAGGVT